MLPRCRSIYGKMIIFTLVILCFVLYLRVLQLSDENEETDGVYHSRFVKDRNAEKYLLQESESYPESSLEDNVVIKGTKPPPYTTGSPYERSIRLDLEKQEPGLGNKGKASYLAGEEKEKGDEIYKKIALNEVLSEKLSYNRTLSDSRHPVCATQKFDLETLPTASVVVIFYNEPYSVLVRTVHSTLNTCQGRLLKEIILVDDGSTNMELHGKLDYYVRSRFPKDKVKLLRMKERVGLIRARLAGARNATGDVLIFLDAHCEANIGWCEPLLQRIKESRSSVLVPIIDVIDAKDFQYSTNGYRSFQVGGFQWSGHYDWIDVPKREKDRMRKDCMLPPSICPTYSPTMAGGLFAIERRYFWEIGSYDEQMDGWGGENLEMSFRVWQCGGTIETIPCSRVGHVFRDFHPYKFPKNRDTHGINTVRMAKVWMDDYLDIFFIYRPDLKYNPDIGDVTHRQVLRKKLRCKSFEWYLKNVYPEKYVPTKNVLAYGKVKSVIGNLCFDDLLQDNETPYNMGVYPCGKVVQKSQLFSLSNTSVLRNEMSCATVGYSEDDPPNSVVMVPCNVNDDYNEKWIYQDQHLIHVKTGLCLDHFGLKAMDHLEARTCDNLSQTQQWVFEHD